MNNQKITADNINTVMVDMFATLNKQAKGKGKKEKFNSFSLEIRLKMDVDFFTTHCI